jgi:dienelactone hydrolase
VLASVVATVIVPLAGPAPASTARGPEPIGRPGAVASPGTEEWYRVPLSDGHSAAIGVYRPSQKGKRPAVLILHGKDGPRRLYEELAERYAAEGFVAVVACWFVLPDQEFDDAYDCPGVAPFRGADAPVIGDVSAIVDAAEHIRGIAPERLGIVGQSYGARVALLRAASTGRKEPVVSSCGYLAEQPISLAAEQPRYPFPADPDVVAGIVAPVLIVHGDADPIVPVGQADAFAAAMRAASGTVKLLEYASPAGHSIPWDLVTSLDDPSKLLRDRFLDDTTSWLHDHLDPS